ncbi:MAG TPA: SpoIIE family protein phosphatase [Bacteroidia bacterium]
MLAISTRPSFITNKFYDSKRAIRQTVHSLMDTTHSFINSSNNKTKAIKMEAELLSHVEILNHSALVSVADLKSNIIYANDLFCKTSGYTMGDLLAMPHRIIRHPDMPDAVYEKLWQTVAEGKVWQGELKCISSAGEAFWVIATIAPVFGTENKPVKYIIVSYDITAQKKTEEELRQAKKRIDMELLESVEYAKGIHSAFLNNTEEIKTISNDAFLIYKAQKIISGDFYKIEKRDGKLICILGDSTGHGVSASYISILALNTINRILKFTASDPSRMLKTVNKELSRVTHSNGKKQMIESADVMACCIDTESMQMTYASAKMRGFIIRKGEVILLEKDKCSIGETPDEEFKITNHSIDLEKGDCLYMFSDGLTDQFGGPQDKRIGIKKIISMVKEVNQYSMNAQKEILEHAISLWQNGNEQTDDITLFGIRI